MWQQYQQYKLINTNNMVIKPSLLHTYDLLFCKVSIFFGVLISVTCRLLLKKLIVYSEHESDACHHTQTLTAVYQM